MGCWVAKWKEICKYVMQCVTRKYCMRGAEAQQRAEQVLGRGNPAQRTILRGMGAARLGGVRASLRWPESQPHVRLLIEPRPGSQPTSSYSCIYNVGSYDNTGIAELNLVRLSGCAAVPRYRYDGVLVDLTVLYRSKYSQQHSTAVQYARTRTVEYSTTV